MNWLLYYENLSYIPKAIQTGLICRYYDNPLVRYFMINKTQELITQKYSWSSFRYDIKTYTKDYSVCLTLKTFWHKPQGDLISLHVPIYQWKDLYIDFMTGLPISTSYKDNSYDSILVIVDRLTKIIYYQSVEFTIDDPKLIEVVINMVI